MEPKKLFSAERRRLEQMGRTAEPEAPSGSNADVLRAIAELKVDLHNLEARLTGGEVVAVQHGPSAEDLEMQASLEKQRSEVNMLKTELRALAVCIEQTKMEIAALRPNDSAEDRLVAVTFELDAIVTATEGATHSILEAAEKIDGLAHNLKAQIADSFSKHLADDISETVVSIFEACNFQDITGQRITKVVNTLKYVEERVNAMIKIWGADGFEDLPAPEEIKAHDPNDDRHLLNGPALENQGISQDEIDKLFG